HLEAESSFTRAVGERLDAAVVQVTTAVEDDLLDAGLLGRVCKPLPDLGRLPGLVALERIRQADPRRGGDRLAGVVVDELREDAAVRAEHGQARALRCAADLAADPAMPPFPELTRGCLAHVRSRRRQSRRLRSLLSSVKPTLMPSSRPFCGRA